MVMYVYLLDDITQVVPHLEVGSQFDGTERRNEKAEVKRVLTHNAKFLRLS